MPGQKRQLLRFSASARLRSRLLRQRRGVVDHDGAVGSAGGETVAVGTEGDAVVATAVPSEGEEFLAGLAVPQLDRRVGRRGGQALVVRTEGDTRDCSAVALQ